MKACRTGACVIGVLLAAPATSATAPALWQISSPTSCPEPAAPLSQVQTNVDREIPKPMTENTSKAQLEVASAYAPQKAGNGANWCVRYEVTNDGADAVPLFNWPLSTLKFEDLKPSYGPQSNVLTLQPGPDPVLKDTVLYGFKSQAVKTKAFQSAEALIKPSLITLVASNDNIGGGSSSTADAFPTLKKNGDRLPEVGGEFTGGGADVGATSVVTRDNDQYHFTIQMGRNDSKVVQSVVAPLTLAFAKLGSDQVLKPSALSSVLKEVQSYEILGLGDTFTVNIDLPVASVPRIYVVRQPISFKRSDKSGVCFLAPTYSPIDISENLMSCP